MPGPWIWPCWNSTGADLVEDDLDQKFGEISRTTSRLLLEGGGKNWWCQKLTNFFDEMFVCLQKKSIQDGFFSKSQKRNFWTPNNRLSTDGFLFHRATPPNLNPNFPIRKF